MKDEWVIGVDNPFSCWELIWKAEKYLDEVFVWTVMLQTYLQGCKSIQRYK